MQITFDTTNPKDLEILNQVLALALGEKAQPAVAQNTGTTGAGLDLSPAASGVDGAGALGAPGADQPAPVIEKPKRVKKEAAAPVEKSAPAAAEQDTSASAQPAEAATAQAKTLTLDEVRAALQQFTASKGVPAGIELLKKYNAGRISELAEEHFAAFAAECAV